MTAHPDILDDRDPLAGAFLRSLVVHLAIVGAAVGYTLWIGGPRDSFGDPDAIGGGTPITPVSALELPQRSRRFQPVAHDTESVVPNRPEPRTTREEPEPDAVALGKKDQTKKKESKLDLAAYLRRRREELEKPNQVYSKGGAAASSDLMGGKPGSGNLGFGESNPFGNRFGYYAGLVRDCLAREWDTGAVDGALRQAPAVTITFQILRSGEARGTRIVESSGNLSLDYSCRRAVEACSPFPPLPAGFERSSANVEFKFQLKR